MPMLDANMGQQMGCMWLDRLHMAAHGVHMAAQRLLLGALGAAYGCSETPYAHDVYMAAQRLRLGADWLHFAA